MPCLHNFCAACCSDVLKQPTPHRCPICRADISEVRRNHDLNNLAEAYLTSHPEKARGADELKELDDRTTITAESLRLRGTKRPHAGGGGGSDSEEMDSDDYDSDDDQHPYGGFGGHAAQLAQMQAQMLGGGGMAGMMGGGGGGMAGMMANILVRSPPPACHHFAA